MKHHIKIRHHIWIYLKKYLQIYYILDNFKIQIKLNQYFVT